jgi:Pyruvate/2-oxoacid:ferredoxin oxidoreductase delta subunit
MRVLGEKMAQPTIDTLIQVGGVVIALVAGFITLFINERIKRSEQEYRRKEERYIELVNALRGFYIDSFDKEKRENFLRQVNLCWLYCPDEVIQKAYKFLMMVHTDQKQQDADKEKAVGEFMLAVRMDLLGRKPVRSTSLRPEDFKHLRAT